MTEESIVPTPAETQNIAETATETPPAPDATEDAGQQPDSTEPAKKPPEQIELERLRRALTKRDRTQGAMHIELQQLRAQLARQPVQPTAPEQQPRQVDEREVLTLAEKIASQKEFVAKCNSVAEVGRKEFAQDFTASLNALIDEAGPLVTDQGATPLGEAILDSDTPAALITYLGKHPEIAAELDGLTSIRLARKLVLVEQGMTAKPKPSAAPKPLEPVRGQGIATGYSPEMSDVAFAKWRKAQKS